jgi:hypothetical protein
MTVHNPASGNATGLPVGMSATGLLDCCTNDANRIFLILSTIPDMMSGMDRYDHKGSRNVELDQVEALIEVLESFAESLVAKMELCRGKLK